MLIIQTQFLVEFDRGGTFPKGFFCVLGLTHGIPQIFIFLDLNAVMSVIAEVPAAVASAVSILFTFPCCLAIPPLYSLCIPVPRSFPPCASLFTGGNTLRYLILSSKVVLGRREETGSIADILYS